jgi:hypothetical protein
MKPMLGTQSRFAEPQLVRLQPTAGPRKQSGAASVASKPRRAQKHHFSWQFETIETADSANLSKWKLLEYLEHENKQLRSKVVDLALQIQALHHRQNRRSMLSDW